MRTKTLFKVACALIVINVFVAIGGFVFLSGGDAMHFPQSFARMILKKVPAEKSALRTAPTERVTNVRADALTIRSGENYFSKNKSIEITCDFSYYFAADADAPAGASAGTAGVPAGAEGGARFTPFDVVIKTDREEVGKIRVNEKTPSSFSASYTPNRAGLIPVACRADFGGEIAEKNEYDNRFIRYIHVAE